MTTTPKKKKTPYKKVPRSKLRYPTFEPKRAVANRRDELDADYIDKLNETEKAWLNQFQEEWIMANFQDKEKLLDKSDEFRKERYRANNKRNKDAFINAKVRGLMNNTTNDAQLEHYIDANRLTNVNEMEDVYAEYLDLKKNYNPDSDD